MRNNRRTIHVFFAVVFMLFFVTGILGISISAGEATGKEVIKEKEAIQEKKEQDVKQVQEVKQNKQVTKDKEAKKEKNPYEKAEITIKIIPSEKKTFGYDILLYGRPLVHQPNIPGLPGNEGFTTHKRAQTVAGFVVKKIRKNEMPPTVTIEDLNRMDVLK